MEQKKKRKFNVIDVIVVILIAAALGFVGWKLSHRGAAGTASTVHISYTVKCEGVDKTLYESCQQHLPSQLMASGELFDGQIKTVASAPYLVLDGSGQWVEDPDHVNLTFDVECNVPRGAVLTTKVGDQEVRVGKSDYILKSEYIEFDKCVITSVTWDK
ncbi:MAG: DUF4330 domain-containing protein [Oscillibacter sp.]|jgi:hypothetical protein|nr:DUF4330 domain-containing protein [Oscillibacter sp.]